MPSANKPLNYIQAINKLNIHCCRQHFRAIDINWPRYCKTSIKTNRIESINLSTSLPTSTENVIVIVLFLRYMILSSKRQRYIRPSGPSYGLLWLIFIHKNRPIKERLSTAHIAHAVQTPNRIRFSENTQIYKHNK